MFAVSEPDNFGGTAVVKIRKAHVRSRSLGNVWRQWFMYALNKGILSALTINFMMRKEEVHCYPQSKIVDRNFSVHVMTRSVRFSSLKSYLMALSPILLSTSPIAA